MYTTPVNPKGVADRLATVAATKGLTVTGLAATAGVPVARLTTDTDALRVLDVVACVRVLGITAKELDA